MGGQALLIPQSFELIPLGRGLMLLRRDSLASKGAGLQKLPKAAVYIFVMQV